MHYRDQGAYHAARGEWCRAIADFTEALRLDPDDTEALHRRGNAYAAQGEHDRAIDDFTTALQCHFDLAVTFMNRALACATQDEFGEAAAETTPAAHYILRLAESYLLRGLAYSGLGDSALALADLNQVIRLAPAYALGYVHRGAANHRGGNAGQAIADFSEALRLDPTFAPAYYYRALTLHAQGAHDRAIADLTSALQLNPDDPEALYQRGNVYLAKSEQGLALADFAAALRLLSPQFTGAERLPRCLVGGPGAEPIGAVVRASAPTPTREAPSSGEEHAPVPFVPAAVVASIPAAVEPPRPLPECAPEVTPDKGDERPAKHGSEGASAETVSDSRGRERTRANPAKQRIRLVCPQCGVAGSIRWDRLDKLLLCQGCKNWYRLDPGGQLAKVSPPPAPSGTGVEVRAGTGSRTIHQVPPPKASLAPGRAWPNVWAGDFCRQNGRWLLVGGGLLTCLALALTLVLRSPANVLKSRAHAVAAAWLAQDATRLRQYTSPADEPNLQHWLAANPPPAAITAAKDSPRINVSVERKDGNTAEIMAQIEVKDGGGTPVVFAVYQRWVEADGTWYFSPKAEGKPDKGGSQTKSKTRGGNSTRRRALVPSGNGVLVHLQDHE